MGATLVLALVLFSSAIGVVYSKHQSRLLFVELEALRDGRDELTVEWGKLQLEQSTWATHGRIEAAARQQLNMRIPEANEVVIFRP